jgi:Putative adhesin
MRSTCEVKDLRYRNFLIVALLLLCSATLARGDDKKQQVERTMAADPRVVMSVCVVSGNLTVRSWDRNEVRVRSSDGVPIEFKRIDANKSELATELKLATKDGRSQAGNSCLNFGDIDLEVPHAATVKLDTTEGDITVTDVARVNAVSQSGNVTIAKANGAIEATTIGGDITVRGSAGSIKLHTIGGSIDGRDLAPAAEEDSFEAGTVGGDVTLDRVGHRRLRVNTVHGSVTWSGPLAREGRYSFLSISGDLNMSLPADSSFRITGTLGHSDLVSDFPLKYSANEGVNLVSKHANSFRRIDAVSGNGSASINVSSFQGSVTLRKK